MRLFPFWGIFVLAALSCGKGETKSAGSTLIDVQDSVYDYGRLQENSGLIPHRFMMTNNTDLNFVILQVSPSCSCMSEEHCRDVARKNEKLWVDVFFNTDDYSGPFEKPIMVKTTLGNFRLYVKGRVE